MATITRREAAAAIAARRPFAISTRSLRGVVSVEHGGSRFWETGRLPLSYREALRDDSPSYVVYSYATPIAWFGRRGWIIPDVGYSVTTSAHQGLVRHGIALGAS